MLARESSLATRKGRPFAQKELLGMPIAKALGQEIEAAGALTKCSVLPTYSLDQLVV